MRTHKERQPRKSTRGRGLFCKPTFNQAAKIIRKFGGEALFAQAVGISRIQAYRMGYSRPAGTDGLVPGTLVDRIQRAARMHGIVLTEDDWKPERIEYDEIQEAV